MPSRRTTPSGYEQAHRLRKSPTPAEAKLWGHLRGRKVRGVSFRRQHAIGGYVVDFCSPKHRLIIELDGGAHVGQTHRDALRTIDLESQGYRVLRFWNSQVMDDIGGVIQAISDALDVT